MPVSLGDTGFVAALKCFPQTNIKSWDFFRTCALPKSFGIYFRRHCETAYVAHTHSALHNTLSLGVLLLNAFVFELRWNKGRTILNYVNGSVWRSGGSRAAALVSASARFCPLGLEFEAFCRRSDSRCQLADFISLSFVFFE